MTNKNNKKKKLACLLSLIWAIIFWCVHFQIILVPFFAYIIVLFNRCRFGCRSSLYKLLLLISPALAISFCFRFHLPSPFDGIHLIRLLSYSLSSIYLAHFLSLHPFLSRSNFALPLPNSRPIHIPALIISFFWVLCVICTILWHRGEHSNIQQTAYGWMRRSKSLDSLHLTLYSLHYNNIDLPYIYIFFVFSSRLVINVCSEFTQIITTTTATATTAAQYTHTPIILESKEFF